jgi:hypothetical protein
MNVTEILDRIKNLQEYHIPVPVEANWMPRGTIPYDIRIGHGVATFTVYAADFAEACDRVMNYMEQQHE